MANQAAQNPNQGAGAKVAPPGMFPNALAGAKAAAVGESVTYLPKDGDPAKVKWGGRMFHANVPLKISDPVLLDKARKNKWFHVGEGAPHVEVEETSEPKTPEQYVAHCVAWLKALEPEGGERALDDRWAAEESLRMSCGVGTSDLDYLATLISPKRGELRRASQAA